MGKNSASRAHAELPTISCADDAIAIVKLLVCDDHTEGQLVLGIDPIMRLCGAAFNCPCDRCQGRPADDAEELVDLAAEMRASGVVVTTFVEPDHSGPTAADVARFEGLRLECADEGIVLFDHFVMTRHEWQSIRALSEGPGASSSW
jgi:hypothetical protein